MLKYLAILVVFLGCAFVIARHDEQATLKAAQESTSKNNPAATCEPDENHPQEHPKYSAWDSPSGHIFHNAFKWPEGITVWAIILTLLAIAEQTEQTAKATRATRDSIKIQEAEFVQWVDIGEWTVKEDEYVDWGRQGDVITQKPEQIKVRIGFHLLNNSTLPLSICSVRTNLQIGPDIPATNYIVGEGKEVPPKGEYGVVIDTVLTGIQVSGYILDKLPIVAKVSAEFTNALRKPGHVEFEKLVICGITAETTSRSRGHVSKEIEN